LVLPSGFVGYALAVGPQGQIYVCGRQDPSTATYGTILEYAAGASGSDAPTVTLNGSAAGTATFTFVYGMAVNSAGTLAVASQDGTLETFASGFTATSAPTQYLTWGKTNFAATADPIALDTAGDIFYVDDGIGRGVKAVFYVFAAGAIGPVAPVRTITGTDTTSFYYDGFPELAVDGAGDLFVAYYNEADDPNATGSMSTLANNEPTGIVEFAAGATGNATPVKRISGTLTDIVEPDGFALDAEGNMYYVDAAGGYFGTGNTAQPIKVFSSNATGNAVPTATFSATGYTYNTGGYGIAAY
jgi:hypothetical protein